MGLSKMGIDVLPPEPMRKVHAYADFIGEKAKQTKEFIVAKYEAYFHKPEEEHHSEHHNIVVTSPKVNDVTISESFVCQIRSQRHIEVRALEPGYLEKILVQEGRTVKGGREGQPGESDVRDPPNSLRGKAGSRERRGCGRKK